MLARGETLLDEGQDRCVIGNRVRDVRRFRERRDRNERDPEPILIESCTGFVWASFFAQLLCLRRAVVALRAAAGTLGAGRIRQVSATAGRDVVGRSGRRRRDVVVKTTVLIVGPE